MAEAGQGPRAPPCCFPDFSLSETHRALFEKHGHILSGGRTGALNARPNPYPGDVLTS